MSEKFVLVDEQDKIYFVEYHGKGDFKVTVAGDKRVFDLFSLSKGKEGIRVAGRRWRWFVNKVNGHKINFVKKSDVGQTNIEQKLSHDIKEVYRKIR